MELESFKMYIEMHLKTIFIQPFKFVADVLILFNKKLNNNLRLCMDYYGLNHLTIKN